MINFFSTKIYFRRDHILQKMDTHYLDMQERRIYCRFQCKTGDVFARSGKVYNVHIHAI